MTNGPTDDEVNAIITGNWTPGQVTAFEKAHEGLYQYQVGSLFLFDLTDPEFTTLDKALSHAIGLSKASIIGIWTSQDKGSELLYIVYNGEVFKK